MQLEVLFVLQLMLVLLVTILLVILIQLKKLVAQTVKDVKEYITFITEDINTETEEVIYADTQKIGKKESKEKEQSQLIHAVLQEYFP